MSSPKSTTYESAPTDNGVTVTTVPSPLVTTSKLYTSYLKQGISILESFCFVLFFFILSIIFILEIRIDFLLYTM